MRRLDMLSRCALAVSLAVVMIAGSLVVLSTPAAAAIVPEWSAAPDMGDVRAQAVVVQDNDGIVYVIGGVVDAALYDAVDSVDSYDPATGEWTELAPMPVGVRGACGALGYDGLIYVFGGVDTPGATYAGTQIYDPDADTWSSGTDMPVATWEGKCAAYSSYLFVAGGEAGATVATLYRYTPESDSWSTMAPMPVATKCGTFTYVSGYLYYVGGVVGSYIDVTSDVWRYYYWSDEWEAAADLPDARAAQAAIQGYDGMLYVFGGGDSGYNAYYEDTVYSSGYVYNPDQDSWTALPDMGVARKYLGAARTSHGMIMSVGGNNFTDVYVTVEEMRIADSTATLVDDSVGLGDAVSVWLEGDFAFATEYDSYAEGYLISGDGVVYDTSEVYVPLDAIGVLGFTVPEDAVPGDYTVVVSYWVYGLDVTTFYWDEVQLALTVVESYTVDERIAMLEANVSNLMASIDVQADEIAALQAQLDDLMATSEGINVTMTEQIAALQEQIDALEASNAELSDSVDTKMESMLGYVIIILVVIVLVLALMNMMMIRKGAAPPPAP